MVKKLSFLDRVYLTVLGLILLFFVLLIADSATGGAVLNTGVSYSCYITSIDEQMMKGVCIFKNRGASQIEKCVDIELCRDSFCGDLSAIKNICSGTLKSKEKKEVQWWFTSEEGKYAQGYYLRYT